MQQSLWHALKWKCARSLARLLLLVHLLSLSSSTGVALRWSSCALLACTGCCMRQMAVAGLRVFLGCHLTWLRLVGLMPVLALASPIFGFGTRAPMCSLLRQTPTTSAFLRLFLRKNRQSWAFWNMPLHLLPWSYHSAQTFATGEVCLVMGIDNMVKECRIILYGVGTEGATQYSWFMPILHLFRQKDWNAHKCMCHEWSSCNSPNGVWGHLQTQQWYTAGDQDFTRTRRLLRWSTVAGCFWRCKCWQTHGICRIENDTTPEDLSWMEGAETPMFLHVGNGRPYRIRVLWLLLTRVGIVMYCLVPFLYTRNPITDELVPPCSKVGVIFACEFTCFAFASILIVCCGDVKQGHTPIQYICLIGRV